MTKLAGRCPVSEWSRFADISGIAWVQHHLPWVLSPPYILAGCIVVVVVCGALLLWKGLPEIIQFQFEEAGIWVLRRLVWVVLIAIAGGLALWFIFCGLVLLSAVGAFFVAIAHDLGLLRGFP